MDFVRSRFAIERPISIQLVSDEQIHELNREFRKLDAPTDVLTFPSPEFAEEEGDVAIAFETAQAQAEARGISFEQEIALLALHGALHLAGFDDESEQERASMVAEMKVVADALGIPMEANWSSLYAQGPQDEHT